MGKIDEITGNVIGAAMEAAYLTAASCGHDLHDAEG